MIRLFCFVVVCFLNPIFFVYGEESRLKVVSLEELKGIGLGIRHEVIHESIKLKFKRFPLASSEGSTWEAPVLPETFVLRIPKGRIFSDVGYVLVGEKYLVSELLWPWSS